MEKLKNKIKNMKGITLVALIITIIILLILTGVSINFVFGNEGIFNKAQTAVQQYQNAQEEEQTKIAKINNEIDNYVSGNRNYEIEINALKKEIQILKNKDSYSTEEKIIGTWVDGKPLYQKTIHFVNQNTTYFTIPIGVPDIDLIFVVPDGSVIDSHNYNSHRQPLPYFLNTGDFISIRAKLPDLEVTKGSAGNWIVSGVTMDMYVTIRYTKTTD